MGLSRQTIVWIVIGIIAEVYWFYFSISTGRVPLDDHAFQSTLITVILAGVILLGALIWCLIWWKKNKELREKLTTNWNRNISNNPNIEEYWNKWIKFYSIILIPIILFLVLATVWNYYFPSTRTRDKYDFLLWGALAIGIFLLYLWSMFNIWIKKRQIEM